ncbi:MULTISPECIES: P-loop ATPase, Sll1717 family [Clostridium]|uniref:Uncharacterized protein n=1 Tax=Clostridium frigoriphilum TaxID=443253 RepID=A0ABU7UNU9_9CLOT|nr:MULTISPECIES: hypothetical protein [Clostridium]MBU3098954.1 hypothetical protein [Clostridium sp. DSM 17811]MBW9173611.1 hypothetical protein [Clostridium estertheticum]WLC74189.1 hypothetical protein KTC99_15630 [Clostridium estertheticum]
MQNTFTKFYQNIGFDSYPFRDRTAEKEDITKLFIKPLDYSSLEDILLSNQTAVICGNRGSGKTIILSDLKSKVPSNKLVCFIDNYEAIPLNNNLHDFYSLILQSITKNLLIHLDSNKKTLKKASRDDKIFLSFLIMKYSDSITGDQINLKIGNVQLNCLKRLVNKFTLPLTTLLNYGTTAMTNFGNELLTQKFGAYLPSISEGTVRKIFPNIHFTIANEFKSVEISYSLFDRSLQLIKSVMGSIPLVLIDKLDEDIRLENDAEAIANLIKELVCDNNLLLNSNIQLFIAVWQIPFSYLSALFRRSKHYVYDIVWNQQQLEIVLNRRLSVYSNNKISKYNNLFCPDVATDEIKNIFILSNSNPRDLWNIFNEIFKAQYSIDNNSKTLCKQAVINGLHHFVEHFEFYEYYPKKKDAQKNTNNVYSYINHLLKLDDTDEFTNEELRQAASTGGSTTNYISGMMNIGLIKKTDNKRAGGAVIYKIKDPKVTYAILNNIDINHN